MIVPLGPSGVRGAGGTTDAHRGWRRRRRFEEGLFVMRVEVMVW